MSAPAYNGFPPPPPTPPTPPPTPQFPAPAAYPGGYPAGPGQLPAQGYAAPYPQQYPAAQGYPPAQLAPPPQQLAQGSIDDFFSQPSGGGKSLQFNTVGTRYIGVVTRALTKGDIQQQTNRQGVPQFFKDNRPKFLMKVPLQMQPMPGFEDGQATWFVKGQARDELVRAMAEAGAPAGPPEPGAIVDVSYVSDRPIPNMTPQKQFRIVYTRPGGDPNASAPAQQAPPAPPAPPAPSVPQYPAPQQAAPAAAQYPAPQQQYPAPVQAAPQQPQAQTPQPAAPSELSADQQALLARLTGGQPAAAAPAAQ